MRNGWVAGAVVAGVSLIAAACSGPVSKGVSLAPEFRPFISPDTKALAGIDLDKLKKAPLYARHAKQLVIPGMSEPDGGLAADIGFDPQRDALNVLAEWNGKAALFLVSGRFNAAQIESKLTSHGLKSTPYQKYRLWGDARISVTFVNKGLALVGPEEAIHRAIDLEKAGNGAPPEELEERLRSISTEDTVWLVSRGGIPFAEMQFSSDISSALSNIVNFVGGVTAGIGVDTGLHARVTIICTSEQGGRRVHDALRGGIGIARLATDDKQPELLQIYDGIEVEQDKAMVQVHAGYPADLSDRLIDLALKRK